jgi:hypothetical protein
MKPSIDWTVEWEPSGRDGYLFYHEGSHELPFYWEFGGDGVVAIIRIDDRAQLEKRHPWAAERKREIFERVAQEAIRQRAPACLAEIDEQGCCIYVRER